MQKYFRVPGRLAIKLRALEISTAAVLKQAALPADLFEQRRIHLNTQELFALWSAISTVSQDPLLGLKLGSESRIESFHPMAIAALSTENLATAVRQMARYKKLSAPEEIYHELDDEEFKVSFRWLLAVENEPAVLADYCLSWMLSLARIGTGNQRLTPVRVEYIRQRTNLRQLERHFGCKVSCDAAQNAIVFQASDATTAFVTCNADLLDMLLPRFNEELQEAQAEDSFVELVRRTIQNRLAGQRPSIEFIAQTLHISPRTMQRRLQEFGYSYQRLLDEARHQMARYYLSNSLLELNETAYLLGFEDPNSFGRAFRIWEGVPPSDWRESQRAGTVH